MDSYQIKTKFQVGDTVFYKNKENSPKTGLAKVTYSGRKYFQIDAFTGNCDLTNPWEGNKHFQLYPDEQAYLDECEKSKILSHLRECFTFTDKGRSLSLSRLRQIDQIVDEAIGG